MLRWLSTLLIVGLLGLDLALPSLDIGRRGAVNDVRQDVRVDRLRVGERMPDLAFEDLAGAPVSLSSLRGHRVLLTFERSVDW